jgi:hypothetical protein
MRMMGLGPIGTKVANKKTKIVLKRRKEVKGVEERLN